MRRRGFIAGAGVSALWPLIAQGQNRRTPPVIGILESVVDSNAYGQSLVAAFRRGLADRGWHEGSDLRIELRWAGADATKFAAFADEFARLRPDAILAFGPASVLALQKAGCTSPIVFVVVLDPIGSGIVTNYAHPGGNVTGFNNFDTSIASKWLEYLVQEAAPTKRVLVLSNYNVPGSAGGNFYTQIEKAAPSFGVSPVRGQVASIAEIDSVVAAFAAEPRGGVVVVTDPFVVAVQQQIVDAVMRNRLPAVYPLPTFAALGGALSYGVDEADTCYRAASYVDRIQKGEKAGDLPVESPTKYELVVNLKTARALGLSLPSSLLATADQVIE